MMWLAVAVTLAAGAPVEDPIPPFTGEATPPAASAAGETTAAAPAPASPAAPKAWALGLEAGLDVPAPQRFPMASTRLELAWRTHLGAAVLGAVGARTGYSYVAGEHSAADPVLGVDEHALVMAHRIPMRVLVRMGLQSDSLPMEVGAQASGGADVAIITAQSFGRGSSLTAVLPAFSAGAYLSIPMGDALGIGVVGEWDSALADLAAVAPGVSGDLSALRLAVLMTFAFG